MLELQKCKTNDMSLAPTDGTMKQRTTCIPKLQMETCFDVMIINRYLVLKTSVLCISRRPAC